MTMPERGFGTFSTAFVCVLDQLLAHPDQHAYRILDVSSPEWVAILGNGDFLVSSADYVIEGGGGRDVGGDGFLVRVASGAPPLRRYSNGRTFVGSWDLTGRFMNVFGAQLFGLRVLAPGDGSGGVVVATPNGIRLVKPIA